MRLSICRWRSLSFRQINRYICTRRIQFILQNLHYDFSSNNDDVIYCFIGRRIYCEVSQFFIFMTSLHWTTCWLFIQMWMLSKVFYSYVNFTQKLIFPVIKGMYSNVSFLHHPLQYDWSASSTILRHFSKKKILDGSLYLGPFSKSDLSPLSWIQLRSPVTTWACRWVQKRRVRTRSWWLNGI